MPASMAVSEFAARSTKRDVREANRGGHRAALRLGRGSAERASGKAMGPELFVVRVIGPAESGHRAREGRRTALRIRDFKPANGRQEGDMAVPPESTSTMPLTDLDRDDRLLRRQTSASPLASATVAIVDPRARARSCWT